MVDRKKINLKAKQAIWEKRPIIFSSIPAVKKKEMYHYFITLQD